MTVSECAYREVKTASSDYSRQKGNGDAPMETIATQRNCSVYRSGGQALLRAGYRTRSLSVSSVRVNRRLPADTSAPRFEPQTFGEDKPELIRRQCKIDRINAILKMV